MKKVIITITGAAGNIAYSLIFRILSGNIFPADIKIQINLLDIAESLPILKGVKYEIEDCAFPNLDNIITTDDPGLAFTDSDYILLVGAKPRFKGMQRADLLLDMYSSFLKSDFEKTESLEQLRFLYNKVPVHCIKINNHNSISINSINDLKSLKAGLK